MPLIKGKSKGAFAHNVKAEIAAGKKPDQAVAIAYATKRSAGGRDSEKSEHHSSHSAKRSEHYHQHVAKTIEPTKIQRGAMKATKARGMLKNRGEDAGEEF